MLPVALALAAQLLPEPLAGPERVGLRVWTERDATRQLEGAARPVQIVLWYPAQAAVAGSAEALRYADYVGLAAGERSFGAIAPAAATGARDAWKRSLSSIPLPATALDTWLAAPMRAQMDLPPANRRFPLVAIAQGNGHAAADQAVLAELLASHGFVVLTTPSPLRLGASMASEDDVLPVAREQARDLSLALAKVRQLPFVAPEVAWLGHSFGARAALLAALGESRTAALVSLDGGIGAATAKSWLAKDTKIDPGRARFPLLHFYEDVTAFMAPDFELFESMREAPRRLVLLSGLPHHHLTSFGWAAAAIPELRDAGSTSALCCGSLAAETVAFLRAAFGGPPVATAPRPDGSRAITWSADTETRRAIRGPVSRLRIDDGGPANGTPVVFVHGNGAALTLWSEALQHLRGGRRAVAFDLRGNGESQPVREPLYAVAEVAADIGAVADALALPRFALVGHSYGASVAIAYAAAHSERVAGLFLVDPAGDVTKAPAEALDRYLARLQSPDYPRVSRAALSQSLLGAQGETAPRALNALAAAAPATFVGCFQGLRSFDPALALGRYPGPVHLLHRAQRENEPTSLHTLLPALEHSTMDGVSHFLMLDKPREFAERLDAFLAKLDATPAPPR